MIDQEEFERINQLRLQAFRTNESQDVENYYKAASSWFQGELDRELKRSHEGPAEITQLRADLAAERELADRTMRALAESRNWNWIDLEDDRDSGVDVDTLLPHLVELDHEISEILTAHATRRNKWT